MIGNILKKFKGILEEETTGVLAADAIEGLAKKALAKVFPLFLAAIGALNNARGYIPPEIQAKAQQWVLSQVIQYFGLESEDERRFNKALRSELLTDEDREKLLARLAAEGINGEWYRLTVMDEDPAEIAKDLKSHATMSDPTWNHFVIVMNLEREKAHSLVIAFWEWFEKNSAIAFRAVRDGMKEWFEKLDEDLEETGLSAGAKSFRDRAFRWVEKEVW